MATKKKGRRKSRGRRARAKARVTDEILFAECIQFAKGLCKDPAWNRWADAWLDATDRGSRPAMDAAEAVFESSEIDPNEIIMGGSGAITGAVLSEILGSATAWGIAFASAQLAGTAEERSGAVRLALRVVLTATKAPQDPAQLEDNGEEKKQ
jgi:hypothetical protein